MNPEDELYQELLLQHSRRPKNCGPLPGATHSADGYNALCGDEVSVSARVEDGTIREARFTASACAICTASASMLTAAVGGRTTDAATVLAARFRRALTGGEMEGLPADLAALAAVRRFPARVKCAALPWETLAAALAKGG